MSIKALNYLRAKRNDRLRETDSYMIQDWPIDDAKKTEWKKYRQALRDLPANSTPEFNEKRDLIGVTWPTKPE
tara:strand:- start:245 stop:463 length:219 start_codon:yes stop_codon:yes gene_type:complete